MADSNASLSWGLLVATYNRPDVLLRSLKLAATQTRPPIEIIVVDASADWEQTRGKVLSELAPAHAGIRWEYLPAGVASASAQRNLAIARSRAAVLCLLDDDSLMYPDCAEKVMRVYEADVQKRIMGIETALAAEPPDEQCRPVTGNPVTGEPGIGNPGTGEPAPRRYDLGRKNKKSLKYKVRQWLQTDAFYVPYDFPPKTFEFPETVRGLPTAPIRHMHGCRMTYRREVFETLRFTETLIRGCYGEDADLSFRAGRLGIIANNYEAKICHMTVPTNRARRYVIKSLEELNQIACHRLYSSDLHQSERALRRLHRRKLLIQFIKDLSERRFDFPQTRAILLAMRRRGRLLAMSEDQLRAEYPRWQESMLSTGRLPSDHPVP